MKSHSPQLPATSLIAAGAVGLGLALVAGAALGFESYVPLLGAIVGVVGIAISLFLKEKIWILIPAMSAISGSFGFLPAPIPLADIAKIYVFGMFIVFMALKVPLAKLRFDALDLILWINLAWLLSVFIRNPAGIRILQTELVGGKPYFIVLFAVLGWWVLSKVHLPPKLAPWFPIINLLPGALFAGLSLITWYFPSTTPVLNYIYSGVSKEAYMATEYGSGVVTDRVMPLVQVGLPIVTLLIGYFRPLSLVNPMNPARFILFGLAMAAVLLSGFRSFFFMACCYYLLGALFKGGVRELPKIAFAGILVFMLVVVFQATTGKLPYGMQRALSFVPLIEWDSMAVADAKGSTDWRREMADEVWNEEGWIRNKILGDGFGMTRRDLELNIQAEFGTVQNPHPDPTLHQKLNGDYHNGPLSAVKFVGIVGLILFTILIIYRGIYSYRIFLDSKDTPYYIPALLAAIAYTYYPFHFFVVFGAYNNHFPGIVLSIGLLRMFRKSLDAYLRENKEPGMDSLEATVRATPPMALGHGATRPALQLNRQR